VPVGKKNLSLTKIPFSEMDQKDYVDQFANLKGSFLANSGIDALGDKNLSLYLEKLANQVISKNEIFFKNLKSASITILKNSSPVHFSLPKGEIFISTGLLSKYTKPESMLVAIIAYELVRSEKWIYPKLSLVPTGYISMEKILIWSRLNLAEKMEVHKWAHHLVVRGGYDGEYYLSWLQTQNRNTADFLLMVGDVNIINREEALFKAFIIKNAQNDEQVTQKNSSKAFYQFITRIRELTT
jgi:hypothetical protein